MREIKFRQALLKENGDFLKFHYWGILGDGGLTGKASGYRTGEDQQYTGLKDKNGSEGYQCDLVKIDGAIYEIIWGEDYAGFFLQHISGRGYLSGLPMFNLAQGGIIGNIYENKELLNAKERD